MQRPDITVATQSRHNLQRLQQLTLGAAPIVLPMPIPDDELLTERFVQPKKGVLFIGRHEGRKASKTFADKVAKAGLPAKVLTNKRGERSFEKTLSAAGIADYEIASNLSGNAKADFIRSAKIAFHPSLSESYGFCAMETLAAGLPTLCIEEREWWRNFEDDGVFVCPSRQAKDKLLELYQLNGTNSGDWTGREQATKAAWSTFIQS